MKKYLISNNFQRLFREEKKMSETGGNYNCDYCPEYSLIKNRHTCTLYKRTLKRGRVPGVWIVPCSNCYIHKTFGGSKNE